MTIGTEQDMLQCVEDRSSCRATLPTGFPENDMDQCVAGKVASRKPTNQPADQSERYPAYIKEEEEVEEEGDEDDSGVVDTSDPAIWSEERNAHCSYTYRHTATGRYLAAVAAIDGDSLRQVVTIALERNKRLPEEIFWTKQKTDEDADDSEPVALLNNGYKLERLVTSGTNKAEVYLRSTSLKKLKKYRSQWVIDDAAKITTGVKNTKPEDVEETPKPTEG